MKITPFASVVLAILLALPLVGCGDDRPSDKIALEAITKAAKDFDPEFTEPVDMKRINGEVVDAGAKIYKVTASYKLRLTKPYGAVITELAKAYQREVQGNVSDDAFFSAKGLESMLGNMQIGIAANDWSSNLNKDAKRERFSQMMERSEAMKNYINQTQDSNARTARINYVLAAWAYFDDKYSFKDTDVAGAINERTYWMNFKKTEQGWQPAP